MNRSVRFLGHPVHQMLVVFPAGLLLSVFLLDAWTLVWSTQGLTGVRGWLLAAGLVGAALAAPFGFLDWRQLPRPSRARRVGAVHGLGNLLATLLFLASWLMSRGSDPPPTWALVASLVAGGILLVTAWLGGELVTRLGVGVYADAHVDASSSLTATEATPSPMQPGHIGEKAAPARRRTTRTKPPAAKTQAPHKAQQPEPNQPPAVLASTENLSVAGEEDPGSAMDTSDMAPRRPPGKRRR